MERLNTSAGTSINPNTSHVAPIDRARDLEAKITRPKASRGPSKPADRVGVGQQSEQHAERADLPPRPARSVGHATHHQQAQHEDEGEQRHLEDEAADLEQPRGEEGADGDDPHHPAVAECLTGRDAKEARGEQPGYGAEQAGGQDARSEHLEHRREDVDVDRVDRDRGVHRSGRTTARRHRARRVHPPRWCRRCTRSTPRPGRNRADCAQPRWSRAGSPRPAPAAMADPGAPAPGATKPDPWVRRVRRRARRRARQPAGVSAFIRPGHSGGWRGTGARVPAPTRQASSCGTSAVRPSRPRTTNSGNMASMNREADCNGVVGPPERITSSCGAT